VEEDLSKPPKTLPSTGNKTLDYEIRTSQWLAHANYLSEAGMSAKAEKAYIKCQFWLDRYNKAAGNL